MIRPSRQTRRAFLGSVTGAAAIAAGASVRAMSRSEGEPGFQARKGVTTGFRSR